MTTQHWLAVVFAVVMLGWQFWPGIKSLASGVKLPAFSCGWLGRTTRPPIIATPTFADATAALALIGRYRAGTKDAIESVMFEAGLKKLLEVPA